MSFSKIPVKPLYDYQFIDLYYLVVQFKKTWLIVTIITIVISSIVSLILPEYYLSQAVVYPNNLTLWDKSTIFGKENNQQDFSYFGNKYDANRLLSFATSEETLDYLINKYDLANHYNYSPNTRYLRTKVKKELKENYSAFKNERDAIELAIYDTDRELAATMLNDIVDRIDKMSIEPVIQSKITTINQLERELNLQEMSLDSLKITKKSGIQIQALEQNIQELTQIVAQYRTSNISNISSLTILQKAMPAEKKSKPIRWLIVTLSILGVWAILLIGLLIIHQYRYLETKSDVKKNF
ncbi:MAG: Wzz/FepE/Etk N-terminal domain-containing protein [Chitinophagales bacterium]|nr:Wzz/FepE/Etk N-terminal domain-containing protein [Chitinophagales bacterium]